MCSIIILPSIFLITLYGSLVDFSLAMINIDLRVEKGFQAISENLTIGETSFAADQILYQIMLLNMVLKKEVCDQKNFQLTKLKLLKF